MYEFRRSKKFYRIHEFSEKYDKMKKILNQGEAYGADWKSL